MMSRNKILPVALVAALLGGTVGALVMHNRNTAPSDAQVASSNFIPNSSTQPATTTDAAALRNESALPATNDAAQNSADPNAYRAGFNDGYTTARDNGTNTLTRERVVTRNAPTRVVYRTARGRRYVARSTSRTAYYDYAPRQRTFWQKHRDKLSVAMGTGGGAILGGLIGGKKGAAIGALAGGGGSALYTYKIRKRHRY
jgi:hypothetical protein